MSYSARLAARATGPQLAAPAMRSGSPLAALDQRLNIADFARRALPTLQGNSFGAPNTSAEGFEISAAPTLHAMPLGELALDTGPHVASKRDAPRVAPVTPGDAQREPPARAAPGSFQAQPGASRPSLEQLGAAPPFEVQVNAAPRSAPREPTLSPPARAAAEPGFRAALGPVLAPSVAPAASGAPAPAAESQREPRQTTAPALPREPSRAESGAQIPQREPAPPREPQFPPSLRQALANVEAWMKSDSPRSEPRSRTPSAAHTLEAREAAEDFSAPRLSIGRIEIEVVPPAAAAPPAVLVGRAPAPIGRPSTPLGRLGFGLRQS